MSEKEFSKFKSRFDRKIKGGKVGDLQALYASIMEGQRKKLAESRTTKVKKRKHLKEEGGDPFSGFATLEVYIFSSDSDSNPMESSLGSFSGNSSGPFKPHSPRFMGPSSLRKRLNSIDGSLKSSGGGMSYRNESIDYQLDNLRDDW